MAFKHHISFATDNFGCDRLRITPDIVSKLLRASIWSCCAVQLKSEQTNFSRTGHRLISAAFSALHRTWFGTCGFLPMSYFYSESQRPINDRSMERINECGFGRQHPLANFIENFISHENKIARWGQKFTSQQNLVDSWTESGLQER